MYADDIEKHLPFDFNISMGHLEIHDFELSALGCEGTLATRKEGINIWQNLFVGDAEVSLNWEWMERAGIKAILNIADNHDTQFHDPRDLALKQ